MTAKINLDPNDETPNGRGNDVTSKMTKLQMEWPGGNGVISKMTKLQMEWPGGNGVISKMTKLQMAGRK